MADATPSDQRAEVIKHLSTEIATQSNYLSSFRTRLAFTILVGPFIVMGGVLVAFKGPLALKGTHIHPTFFAIIVAVFSYFGLAIYGAKLDKHITDQCDKWRGVIISLLNGNAVGEHDIDFDHKAMRVYIWGFVLVFAAFISMMFLLTQLLPTQPK